MCIVQQGLRASKGAWSGACDARRGVVAGQEIVEKQQADIVETGAQRRGGFTSIRVGTRRASGPCLRECARRLGRQVGATPMSARGSYRSIHTVLLNDADFQKLTPSARLLVLVLKICLGPSGIDVLYEGAISGRTGLGSSDVQVALNELTRHGWVLVDGNILWLVRGLKWEPSFSVANPRHRTSIAAHLAGLPHRDIISGSGAVRGMARRRDPRQGGI